MARRSRFRAVQGHPGRSRFPEKPLPEWSAKDTVRFFLAVAYLIFRIANQDGSVLKIYDKYDRYLGWEFFQYVSPMGRRVIDDWRKTLPVGPARADMDYFLKSLAKKARWEFPDIDTLKGKPLKGLTELRWKSAGVPHRLFGYQIGNCQYLFLIGCTHGDKNKYDPRGAKETAAIRRDQIQRREATYAQYPLISNTRTDRKSV